jgi:hypothetical protein
MALQLQIGRGVRAATLELHDDQTKNLRKKNGELFAGILVLPCHSYYNDWNDKNGNKMVVPKGEVTCEKDKYNHTLDFGTNLKRSK